MLVLEKNFSAVLLDMDGTLIDSTAAVVAHWMRFGEAHSLDPALILATSHGRRTIEIIREVVPEKATPEYVRELEASIPRMNAEDAVALPGAMDLLNRLHKCGIKWAIVTSGTYVLANAWIQVMGLTAPDVLVTGDVVEKGKPAPEPYLMGAEKLGLPASKEILVVEDAPAGVRAGKSAGCFVLGLLTTHTEQELIDAGADFIVKDLSQLQVLDGSPDQIRVKFLRA